MHRPGGPMGRGVPDRQRGTFVFFCKLYTLASQGTPSKSTFTLSLTLTLSLNSKQTVSKISGFIFNISLFTV